MWHRFHCDQVHNVHALVSDVLVAFKSSYLIINQQRHNRVSANEGAWQRGAFVGAVLYELELSRLWIVYDARCTMHPAF